MGISSAQFENLAMHASPPLAPDTLPVDMPSLSDMVARLMARGPTTGSDALRELRAAFPDSPLRLRVEALTALMRQRRGS